MQVRTSLDIGLIIRERRRRLKLDQAELARRAGVSRQWIVEIEHGKPRAELGLVLRTLGVLGINLSIGGEAAGEAVPAVDIDALLDALAERRP